MLINGLKSFILENSLRKYFRFCDLKAQQKQQKKLSHIFLLHFSWFNDEWNELKLYTKYK